MDFEDIPEVAVHDVNGDLIEEPVNQDIAEVKDPIDVDAVTDNDDKKMQDSDQEEIKIDASSEEESSEEEEITADQ